MPRNTRARAKQAASSLRTAGVTQVIEPNDPRYDGARRVWNGDIDRRPALIARCQGVADVIASVNAGRDHELCIAIRGGAHNAAGFGTCDDGLVIDVSAMRGIRVTPDLRFATAQTGVVWSELDRETQAFGLATPGGLVSNTGIAGLTLGGGLGWLMGKFGLSIDNVVCMDLVTAEGRYLHASERENPGLFWALRGGGGNFGVVTSITYRLHEHGPMVLGGLVAYPLTAAREVLHFYREFSVGLPDEAEVYAGLMTMPELGPVAAILVGYNGDPSEGARVFEPVRRFGKPILDAVGPMTHIERQRFIDEGNVEHGPSRYWKSGYTETLSDAFIDAVIGAGETFTSSESSLLFFRVHGAAARVADDATAFALRREKWDFNVIAQWRDPREAATHKAWARNLWRQLEPLTLGAAYVNHLAADDSSEKFRASFGGNYDRLAAIKAEFDPDNLFRINPNIRPAT